MSILVLKPGLLSSIQDLGRLGYQRHGIIVSGAMDSFAMRIANLLVGNKISEAVLEITLTGPTLQFNEDTIISICGADLNPMIEGVEVPIWCTIGVRQRSVLSFQSYKNGCRVYLAVAGGFDVGEVLGSKSTYLRAKFGGLYGRALKTKDILPLNNPSKISLNSKISKHDAFVVYPWHLSQAILPKYQSPFEIRTLAGPQYAYFSKKDIETFFNQSYEISSQSDRMGYRLKGEPLSLTNENAMISEAVAFGSVQVPADGQPIVLLADRQTIGGYPKIAQVASVDLALIAQAKPGDQVKFKKITLKQAQSLYIRQETTLKLLKQAINISL